MSDKASSSSSPNWTPNPFAPSVAKAVVSNPLTNPTMVQLLKTPIPSLRPNQAAHLWQLLSTTRVQELALTAIALDWNTDVFYCELAELSPFLCAAEVIFGAYKIIDATPDALSDRFAVMTMVLRKLKEHAESTNELGAGQAPAAPKSPLSSSSSSSSKSSPEPSDWEYSSEDDSESDSDEPARRSVSKTEPREAVTITSTGTRLSGNEVFAGEVYVRRSPNAQSAQSLPDAVKRDAHDKRVVSFCDLEDVLADGAQVTTLVSRDQAELDDVVKAMIKLHHAKKPFTAQVNFCFGGEERRDVYDVDSVRIPHVTTYYSGLIHSVKSLEADWPYKEKAHICVVVEGQDVNFKRVRRVVRHFRSIGAVVIYANRVELTSLSAMTRRDVDVCGLLRTSALLMDGPVCNDGGLAISVFQSHLLNTGDCMFIRPSAIGTYKIVKRHTY